MYDNRFFNGIGLRSAVYLSVVVVGLAISGSVKADNVPLPPPTTTEAQTQVIQSSNGRPILIGSEFRGRTPITVGADGNVTLPSQPKPTSQHFGNVQNGVATKTNPVRITDPYGNVSRTTVTTQTQLPQSSTLSKMGTGLMAGIVAGNLVNSPHAKTAAGDLARGDYGSAAAHAVAAFDVFGIGTGIYGAIDEYQNVKAAIAPELQKAAEAKAQAAVAQYDNSEAARAQAIADAQANGGVMYSLVLSESSTKGTSKRHLGVFSKTQSYESAMFVYHGDSGKLMLQASGSSSLSAYAPSSISPDPGASPFVVLNWERVSANQIKDMPIFAPTQSDILNSFLLNQAEIEAVIAQTLTQMLASQKENTAAIKDLVNMLWANNQLNANNTQTEVVGTPAQNTVLSAPYTPAGTNQAQQTQHVVNRDGSITTSYIPRPDLGANSSVAPTRTKVGTGKSGTKIDVDVDGGSGSEQQKVEICTDKTDGTVMCLPAGSDDYEDLEVPQETETLEFDKKNYFARNAACPAPLNINAFGMSMQMSYEPWCEMARGIRPIIEFLGVLTAMGIAYGAVREL